VSPAAPGSQAWPGSLRHRRTGTLTRRSAQRIVIPACALSAPFKLVRIESKSYRIGETGPGVSRAIGAPTSQGSTQSRAGGRRGGWAQAGGWTHFSPAGFWCQTPTRCRAHPNLGLDAWSEARFRLGEWDGRGIGAGANPGPSGCKVAAGGTRPGASSAMPAAAEGLPVGCNAEGTGLPLEQTRG